MLRVNQKEKYFQHVASLGALNNFLLEKFRNLSRVTQLANGRNEI
jgi:hypothetical protein